MGSRFSGLGNALYDSKRKEFLGRDGAKWGKLGVFYFFFYLGLAGFFCAMLAIFMALTPRDHPYYTADDSRMTTRSNPLSPGLGFRPQPDVERNLIEVEKNNRSDSTARYVKSINQYLQVYYWNQSQAAVQNTRNSKGGSASPSFSISNPGDCTNTSAFGYKRGRPCVLVKMNKIVDFVPDPFDERSRPVELPQQCAVNEDTVPIACQGEYPADIDNVGPIRYLSERGDSPYCGTLNINRFPYRGKYERKDGYQAPYIWVQFQNPKPNVLINVICRIYGENIDFDKKAGRGLTRFQIFVKSQNTRGTRSVGEL